MIDTGAEAVALLRARFPALAFRDARVVTGGWDSLVLDLDGEWIVRFPRRPEVARRMECELRLLPELAPLLPVAAPRFELVARNGVLCVGHRRLAGSPAAGELGAAAGLDLGRFLATLHRFPAERARALGVPFFEPAAWRERYREFCDELRRHVFPLLRHGERSRAEVVFRRVDDVDFVPALVHADLGPAHVLCRRGRVAGVIDWTDVRVADAALDLAWGLHGTPAACSAALARAYGVDPALRDRALLYHRLGPWHEVVWGIESGQPAFVASGLAGVRERLPPDEGPGGREFRDS